MPSAARLAIHQWDALLAVRAAQDLLADRVAVRARATMQRHDSPASSIPAAPAARRAACASTMAPSCATSPAPSPSSNRISCPANRVGELFLSFLPLSHAYEHTAGQYMPIGMGGQIAYCEGLEKLAANIEEVRPTFMVVVPRLFEVLRMRIAKQIEKQGGVAVTLLNQALRLARKEARGESLNLAEQAARCRARTHHPQIDPRQVRRPAEGAWWPAARR